MNKGKTLLVIVPNEGQNTSFMIVHGESGECLATHFCSHEGFAYNDLYGSRKSRKVEWTNRFGELEVKFIKDSGISEDELMARNKKWYDNLQKDKS